MKAISYKGHIYAAVPTESITELGTWLIENGISVQLGQDHGKPTVVLSGRLVTGTGTRARTKKVSVVGTGKDIPAALLEAVSKWTEMSSSSSKS